MDIEKALALTDALVFNRSGGHLSDLQRAILQASWSLQRQSYDQIADTYGYSPTYLKHDVGPKLWKLLSETLGETVTKTNFRAAIERRLNSKDGQNQVEAPPSQKIAGAETNLKVPDSNSLKYEKASATSRQDWGEAVDISFFYGRKQELAQLQQWIIVDRCRLIALLGMGGMGKTSLSVRLAQQLQDQFELVIWRSLRNAPPVQETLAELLQFLVDQETAWPETVDGKISRLLHYMRSRRCLLVLDNVETILQAGSQPNTSHAADRRGVGNYRDGYEGYGELFRQLASPHQSCLVLTSREKPQEIGLLEGEMLPVRSLQLSGLQKVEGKEIFRLKGSFQGSEDEWSRLIDFYSGNPLALKIVSTTIQNLFNGSLSEFLDQDAAVFGNIRNLLEQQFERLSEFERTVIYWLAIYREPASFSDLRADIFPPISPQSLIEVLESLEQRSLIERSAALFSLQPVVMEYVTDRFVEQICKEVQTAKLSQKSLFRSHALLKTQAKDYIRETQVRLILKSVIEHLSTDLAATADITIEDCLTQLLSRLRGKPVLETGYAGGNILNLLCQRQTFLSGYDFSNLTVWQVYLQGVNLHHVNFAHSDLTHSVFTETLGIVFGVAFSPDGKILATGDAESGLRLWQVTTGRNGFETRPYKICEGHTGWVWAVAFSADGQILASCSSDKTIRLWDASTGQCLNTLQGHTSSVWSVAFSADGQTLASGSDDQTVRLWNVGNSQCRQILSGHTGSVLSVAFSADGQTLASGSDDQTVRLWNVGNGQCRQILSGHTEHVWSVTFTCNDVMASGSADCTIKLWSVSTGQCLNTLQEHTDRVRSVTFSPNAQTLISGSDDQTIKLWDVNTAQCLNTLRGHTNAVFSVVFNADGQTIASSSSDQTVRFWNVNTGRCLRTWNGYTNSVFSVVFSADGQFLASGSTDQTVRLWDASTSQCLNSLLGHDGWVRSVAFHPAGHLLASSSTDQTIRLWSVSTGQCLKILEGHSNWVHSVAFSPDGHTLASSGDDQTIRLWSVNTGQCLNVLRGHTSWVWSVTFSPDGHTLASSSEDQTVCLWSVSTGHCLHTLPGHTSRIQSVAFSPDGQTLSSGSGDQTVRLWSVSTGECLKVLEGHGNSVWSVAFSPNSAILASGSLDQTVKLWDISTGTCLKTLPVLTNSIRSSLAFNPIGVQGTEASEASVKATAQVKSDMLASGSQDGTIKIWHTGTGECLSTLIPDRPYKGMNITGVTGLTSAQKATLKALGAVETE